MTKTALITGAASGLGYELALLLANDGYDLILIDIDNTNLQIAKTDIEKMFSCSVSTLLKDLSKPNVAAEIMEEINHVPVDVLVNNAGFGLFGTFANTEWERELDMLHVHILTTTHLTKLILEGMLKRGSGKILNMSSLAAFQPGPLMSIYYASKSYLLSFSEAIANELKGTGITVTALCPGPTKTSFQKVVSKNTSENKISFNMACASEVALYGYNAMQKGKTVAIPGAINKFLSTIHRFVSRSMATRIVRNLQEKNRDE
ncbi:2-dehydro-3-deoxy-D-gluconate 5-dehydrogenase [Mariniflexile rhizosphaerae]|uniref:SDR family NAD(P)-dependent oxidoreductase n=1 Tax=unclassified Mariniflexile TaxID=2643887 RepID=UPI000E32F712|nr:SDR family oxidoreductase [Mariniflexile sp. TRM1-10]AXP81706.1 2-dehydro-3-deoxy-D-gluconate 5-dehydrogenase [Mariniflexile sp. TRM1-10]